MEKVKGLIVLAVVLLMLVSGAVTVYAVSADQSRAAASAVEQEELPADYAAEEMAVGAYYRSLAAAAGGEAA